MFFIAVKLVWVLVPAAVMGIPRLGDDALVYLWNGVNTVVHPRTETPAVRDIVRLRNEPTVGADLEHARARVTMRVTGVSASPFALATGTLLAVGISPKAAFAILEAFTALVLALAIAWSLMHLVGERAAAVALAFLALALLPNQGLHYLVPSVLVLALGLILWTAVLRGRPTWLVALLPVIMLLTHPIGPVYVLVAAALVIGQAMLGRRLTRTAILHLLLLAASVPLWLAINALSGAREPVTAGLGGLSLAAIPLNVRGLGGHLLTLAMTQPVLAVLLLIGLWHALRQWRELPEAFVLAGVLLGVVLSTVVVDVPGYPGELPSRALVALVIVCSGIAAGWALEVSRDARRRPAWIAAALLATWCTQAPAFVHLAFANANSRHQLVDEAQLQREIARLPDGATVVWADTDLALMAGLLAGADRLHAVPYRMLDGPGALRAHTAGAARVFVATSTPERLNGMSTIGAWSLQRRYYGYGFDRYRRVAIYASGTASLPAWLRLEGDAQALRVTDGAGRACTLQLAAAPAAAHWYALEGCGNKGMLYLESTSPRLRLTGLSLSPPDPDRPWPWGENGLRLRAEPRAAAEAPEVIFSYAYLLGKATAESIESELGPLTLVSSRSGLVWLEAAVRPHKP